MRWLVDTRLDQGAHRDLVVRATAPVVWHRRAAHADALADVRESLAVMAYAYALSARRLRAIDEGEPLVELRGRHIEENMWRAIRWGLSGELIDYERGETMPARARIEQLIEWVLPVAEELGAAPWLAVPERNAAERQIARHEERATMEQIFAEQVEPERVTG